jgi:hypothetical protein
MARIDPDTLAPKGKVARSCSILLNRLSADPLTAQSESNTVCSERPHLRSVIVLVSKSYVTGFRDVNVFCNDIVPYVNFCQMAVHKTDLS